MEAIQDHDRTDPKMEVQVTTFDLAERNESKGWVEASTGPWQEDEDDVPSQVLLHDAMQTVLRNAPDHMMHPKEIAAQIEDRRLYRRPDGQALTAGQIRARSSKYPHLSGRDQLQITLAE